MFRLLFNYPISKWILRFNFWTFLFLLLFDGNIQQFSFYQSTDWKNMFFFNFQSKLLKIQTIFFGLCVVLVSTTLYFLSYSIYSIFNRHIMDNNRNSFFGHLTLIFQFGVRNLILGTMNSFLRGMQYKNMLLILVII